MDIKPVSKALTFFFFFIIIIILIISPILEIKNLNFTQILLDERFLNSIIFGLKSSLTATFISTIFGIPAGYYLARNHNYFKRIVDSMFEIPLIIPPLVIGTMLLIFFNKIIPDFIFTMKGAVVAQFFISFPYVLKASKNSFELVPEIYEQIAMTLGAKPIRSFFDTTFKLSFGGIMSGVILSWIRSFGEFGATLLIAGGIANSTENVPIYIYQTILEGDFNKGLGASIIIIFIGLIFLFMVKRKI